MQHFCQTGHLCSVKHHSEVMFIIYDVLHRCIIIHRRARIGCAVWHWFVVLGQSFSNFKDLHIDIHFTGVMSILVPADPNLVLVIFYDSS